MKKVSKSVFFIIVALIACIAYLTINGVTTQNGDVTETVIKSLNDIRWGIDIRGGVDVTFTPPDGIDATDEEMAAAESVISVRLVSQNITDSEVYTDLVNDRIIVRFPWKADEVDFNPEEAIAELGETAMLTFRAFAEADPITGAPMGPTAENIILQGLDVTKAAATVSQNPVTGQQEIGVSLEFSEEGAVAFSEATGQLIGYPVSIWMDNTMISAPIVNSKISEGVAQITGGNALNSEGTVGFTMDEAVSLANKINSGALPFALQTENYNSISPTLGTGAKDAMVLAGGLAFLLVSIIMIVMYRVPGFVAVIALFGQVILTLASLTGFFSVFPSFTLTLPGIAGIILAIGFGVDANIITAERIKEELYEGKALDHAINKGFGRAFSAILDSNVTVIFVAIILMGAFGPPNSMFSSMLAPIFFMFGPSAEGTIYSFGFTLLVGVILNLVMGVLASRFMLKSISQFKFLRNPAFYGGESNE